MAARVGPEGRLPGPQEKWAQVGDLKMRYLDWGGNGPAVLALHGLASSAHWYDLVAPLLRDRYRIIAPDQRGHGKTTAPPNGYDWQSVASDVVGLMEALDLHRFSVLGHSWGGYVALNAAARFPENVRQLVMIEGGFFDMRLRPEATWEGFKARLAPRAVSGTRQQFLDRLRSQLSMCWNSEVERIVQTMIYEKDGQIYDVLHPDHHAQVLEAMWNEPASHLWGRISCPTLIVPAGPGAENAASAFVKLREDMVGAASMAIRNCRICWIPDTIHDIGYHKPGELAQVIAEFLSDSPKQVEDKAQQKG